MERNLNISDSPIVRIIEFNPSVKDAVGVYSELGGKNEYLKEVCTCPSCSGKNLSVSDYIGYLQCNDCKISLNASEFYIDAREKNKVFTDIINEVKSNVDNYALTQILEKELHLKFEEKYYTAEFKSPHPKFFFWHPQYSTWIRYLRDIKDTVILPKALAARDKCYMTGYIYNEFLFFVKMGVLLDPEDGYRPRTINIAKHVLLLKVRELTRKIKSLKEILEDYGIY